MRFHGSGSRAGAPIGAALFLGLTLGGLSLGARAYPPPAPPRSTPFASPTPVAGAVLPYGSTLFFVLDDGVNSASTPPGAMIRMHLKEPLVVNGITLAPEGAPGAFQVVSTSKAQSGDIDGSVQIHLEPFTLTGGPAPLPIRAFHEYLTRELTGGAQATRGTIDTVTDVFVPYAVLYQALRKGHQMVLPPGSILRAETAATIDVSDPKTIVLSTPAPFKSNYDPPHADLTPAPFYTPAPLRPKPLPKGKPTLPPTPLPSLTPGGTESTAGATAMPSAGGTPAAPAPGPSAPASSPSPEPSPVASGK